MQTFVKSSHLLWNCRFFRVTMEFQKVFQKQPIQCHAYFQFKLRQHRSFPQSCHAFYKVKVKLYQDQDTESFLVLVWDLSKGLYFCGGWDELAQGHYANLQTILVSPVLRLHFRLGEAVHEKGKGCNKPSNHTSIVICAIFLIIACYVDTWQNVIMDFKAALNPEKCAKT